MDALVRTVTAHRPPIVAAVTMATMATMAILCRTTFPVRPFARRQQTSWSRAVSEHRQFGRPSKRSSRSKSSKRSKSRSMASTTFREQPTGAARHQNTNSQTEHPSLLCRRCLTPYSQPASPRASARAQHPVACGPATAATRRPRRLPLSRRPTSMATR